MKTILFTYFIHVFHLQNIPWLEECNNLRKLDFNTHTGLKAKLNYVNNYNSISIKILMKNNKKFV